MKKGMLAALLCLILLSGCGGKPEPLPLEELPQDYSLEQAKADGCLVTEDGTLTSGRESWEDFLEAVDAGKAASVRLCGYFTLGSLGVSSWYDPDYTASIKNAYPKISLEDLSYDREGFTAVSYQEGKRYEWNYSLLRRFEEEVQSDLLPYDSCISYILTDDAEATYDQLFGSLVSSRLEDHIPFHIVYREEITLEAWTAPPVRGEPDGVYPRQDHREPD